MIWDLCKKHRTKLLGAGQVATGAIITYLPNLQANMRPLHYGLAMMAIGVSTSVMGFFNSAVASDESISSQRPPGP